MNRLKIGLYTALVVLVCAAAAVLVPRWWVERELARMDASLRASASEVAARVRPGAQGSTPGESPGAALEARTRAGADVTAKLDGGVSTRSSLPAAEADLVLRSGAKPGLLASAGQLPPVTVRPELPAVPLLVVSAPAYRVLGVELPASVPGSAVVSLSAAPALGAAVAFQWAALAALAVLLVLGLLTLASVTDEQRAVVPRQLVSVADRIARGDFSARAPTMAGSLGSLAAALNRAAEEAALAQAARSGGLVGDRFGGIMASPEALAPVRPSADLGRSIAGAAGLEPQPEASAVAPVPASDPFAPAARQAPPVEPTPPPARLVPADAPATAGEAPAAAEGPAPRLAEPHAEHSEPAAPEPGTAPYFFPPPSVERSPEPAAAEQTAAAPPLPVAHQASPVQPTPPPAELAPADAAAPGPAASGPAGSRTAPGPTAADEQHWQVVYDEFVRMRSECKEPGRISFDRFRQQLLTRREAIMARKACQAVRFEVFVKDGKTAIKATAVASRARGNPASPAL